MHILLKKHALVGGGLPAMQSTRYVRKIASSFIAGKPPPTVPCLLQDSAVSETQGISHDAYCVHACNQPSRSTVNGLAFSARRVPNTPAPPTSSAPISGSSNSHGCGLHSSEKA